MKISLDWNEHGLAQLGIFCDGVVSYGVQWLQGGEKVREEAVLKPPQPPRVGTKPKNCLISDKKGKKKISWQDPVALKV